ncbi:hypothetical protein [Sanguibacter gelidistatuariae]|uniref:hypothetical protein n=1 Tax=Sanguibacter gelidistatuariae TaxID=1814289 RepID=UPI00158808A0|nr:hypothetical protein [Sanguibacter gelidistatuariae]
MPAATAATTTSLDREVVRTAAAEEQGAVAATPGPAVLLYSGTACATAVGAACATRTPGIRIHLSAAADHPAEGCSRSDCKGRRDLGTGTVGALAVGAGCRSTTSTTDDGRSHRTGARWNESGYGLAK